MTIAQSVAENIPRNEETSTDNFILFIGLFYDNISVAKTT